MMSWQYIGAAVQGRSHLRTGTPCQDKISMTSCGAAIAVALADGAGSASLSHIGAETASAAVCQYLAERFDSIYEESNAKAVRYNIITCVRDQLMGCVQQQQCALEDLASTLLFVCVKDNRFIIGHLGDGVIGYVKNWNDIRVASAPNNGEFANETVFSTSKDAERALRLIKGELNGIRSFVLMSDGTAFGLYNKAKKTLSPALARLACMCSLLRPEYMQESIQNALNLVKSKATQDDCSMVVISSILYSAVKGQPKIISEELRHLTDSLARQSIPAKHLTSYIRILVKSTTSHNVRYLAKCTHLRICVLKRRLRMLEELNLLNRTSAGLYTTPLHPDFIEAISSLK